MLIAEWWFNAMRVPLTRQRLVLLPEIFVTSAASPKPISRTRWQKLSSPVNSHTRAVAPGASWHRGSEGGDKGVFMADR